MDRDREDAVSSVSVGRHASVRSPSSTHGGGAPGPGSVVSATSEAALSPEVGTTLLAGVDIDEVRKAAMHTAAERARLRRQQEEEEREREKERARKKAAELEEKIRAMKEKEKPPAPPVTEPVKV